MSFTFRDRKPEEVLVLLEDYLGWKPQERKNRAGEVRGHLSYTHSVGILHTGCVAWHPSHPEFGVHVDLPSSALAEYNRFLREREEEAPLALIQWVVGAGGKFTRLDVALDDRIEALSMQTIREHFEAEAYVTRVQRDNISYYGNFGGGLTIYVGSAQSEKRLRIYDKREEQRQKGADVRHPWIRVEGQYRGAIAQEIATRLLVGLDLAGVFRDQLDFRVREKEDSNRRRWDTAPFWESFLEYATRAALSLPGKPWTWEQADRWVRLTVAPTFAMLYALFGPDYAPCIAHEGAQRWKERHRAVIALAERLGSLPR